MATLPPDQRAARIGIAADHGMANVEAIANASVIAGVPFHLALALIEGESGGRNIYGHDQGGVNAGPGDTPVTARNFAAFLVAVMNGATSNGVGPAQITYAGTLTSGHRDGGYFKVMLAQGYAPWVPVDNVAFALRVIVAPLLARYQDVALAGAHYNGGTALTSTALAYGKALAARDLAWRQRFGLAG